LSITSVIGSFKLFDEVFMLYDKKPGPLKSGMTIVYYIFNKFYMNLSKYGNTSSASIILALDELNKKNLLKKGSKIIIIGFGGGLTYGSALINWNKVSK